MSAPQHCIGHISTPYGDAAILVGRYPSGGAIAIQLVDDEDPSEPLATFSTNLVPYGASVAEDELAKGFAGQYKSAQETADAIAAAWEKITDQIGRDSQIALYKASLGM